MSDPSAALSLLSAMITPAVLISACGTLIFSTATRLSRIVDRVRELSRMIEELAAGRGGDFPEEHRAEVERQLDSHAQRGRLIQASLTSFYMSLGIFVGTTIAIGVVALMPELAWVPSALGILGTVILFHGSVLLIRETRIALKSVNAEMEFTLRLRSLYQARDRERASR
jgi:threonine/homoserine/homoserine lactone efflux protein